MFREAKLESTAQFVKNAFYSLYVVAAAADVVLIHRKMEDSACRILRRDSFIY